MATAAVYCGAKPFHSPKIKRNKRYETAEMSAAIGALWICGKACRHQICDISGNVVLHGPVRAHPIGIVQAVMGDGFRNWAVAMLR